MATSNTASGSGTLWGALNQIKQDQRQALDAEMQRLDSARVEQEKARSERAWWIKA